MSEKIQIPVVIDNRQAKTALDDVGKKAVQTGEKVGTSIKKVGRDSARAVVAMSGSIGAVTAGVAAQERAWLSVGNTVLTSFAAGGIIGGSVAAVGALIGVLTASLKDGTKETEERIKSLASSTSGLRAENRKLFDELERVRGVDLVARDAAKARDRFRELTNEAIGLTLEMKELQKTDDEARVGLIPASERSIESRRISEIEMQIEAIAKLKVAEKALIDELQHRLDVVRRIDEGKEAIRLDDLNKKIRDQVGLMEDLRTAQGDFGRFQAQLEAQKQKLLAQGASKRDVGLFGQEATAGFVGSATAKFAEQQAALERQMELLNAITPLERARIQIAQNLAIAIKAASVSDDAPEKLKRQAEEMKASARELAFAQTESVLRDGPGEFERFQASIKPGIAGALSQGIMAGAKDGFKGATDVALSFLNTLSGSFLNSAANVAINALGSSFGGSFAGGGDFIADRPQLIQVGERGSERVRVDPLTGSRGANASKGGGGDTFHFSFSGDLSGLSPARLEQMVRNAMGSYSNAARKRRARDSRRAL